MRSVLDIPVQKLFVVTIVLKVLSSGIGWRIGDPWGFGLAIPLAIMAGYILLGLKRRNSDVSDEKFADTCYYLGFIFTITSIIFSLFDLPSIGTKMSDIAVRFGAAMVSTVFGLVVRVYLVSFKQDTADAMAAVEDSVIEASNRFREHLTMAAEKLHEFEMQVDVATRGAVERVNLQMEALSKSYGEKLTEFFKELAAENKETSNKALDEVKAASQRLSQSVDGYSEALRTNLKSIEDKVTMFATAVTDRLKTTTFPDDYFARNLAQPVAHLREAAGAISVGVAAAADEVKQSAVVLSAALKSLRTKATNVENALDRVTQLAETQGHILAEADSQLNTLSELARTMERFDGALAAVVETLGAQTAATAALTERADSVFQTNVETAEHAAAIRGKMGDTATDLPKVVALIEEMSRKMGVFGSSLGSFSHNLSALNQSLGNLEAKVSPATPTHLVHPITNDFGDEVRPRETGTQGTPAEMRVSQQA